MSRGGPHTLSVCPWTATALHYAVRECNFSFCKRTDNNNNDDGGDGGADDDVYDYGVCCYAGLRMDSIVLMLVTRSQHGAGRSLSSLRRTVVPSVTDHHRPAVALHGHHRHRHRYRPKPKPKP